MPELLTAQERDFEAVGSPLWEPVDPAIIGVARDTSQAHGGVASMQYTTLTLSGVVDAHQLRVRPIRALTGVIVGNTYSASCWVKATDLFVGRGASLRLHFADAVGAETVVASDSSSSISSWTFLSCSGAAPAGAVRVIPYIAFGGGYTTPESDQWIDDVSLDGVLETIVGKWGGA